MKKEHPGQGSFGPWRKSSFSNPNGNECVEVAFGSEVVGLRDSKHPEGPKLVFESQNWRTFVASTRPNN